MYLTLQFPLLDVRPLIYAPQLLTPLWGVDPPDDREVFVRSFGIVHHRPSGTVVLGDAETGVTKVWDRVLCTARRALRFDQDLAWPRTLDHPTFPIAVAFRRFSHDRGVVAAFEIAFEIEVTGRLLAQQTNALIHHLLALPVRVPNLCGSWSYKPLHQAGTQIAWLYACASTPIKQLSLVRDWWVQCGQPLLIVTKCSDEPVEPPACSRIRQPEHAPLLPFLCGRISCGRKKVLPFFFGVEDDETDVARTVRRTLLLGHATEIALLKLDGAFVAKRMLLLPGMRAYGFLEQYLEHLERQLGLDRRPMIKQALCSSRGAIASVQRTLQDMAKGVVL